MSHSCTDERQYRNSSNERTRPLYAHRVLGQDVLTPSRRISIKNRSLKERIPVSIKDCTLTILAMRSLGTTLVKASNEPNKVLSVQTQILGKCGRCSHFLWVTKALRVRRRIALLFLGPTHSGWG